MKIDRENSHQVTVVMQAYAMAVNEANRDISNAAYNGSMTGTGADSGLSRLGAWSAGFSGITISEIDRFLAAAEPVVVEQERQAAAKADPEYAEYQRLKKKLNL